MIPERDAVLHSWCRQPEMSAPAPRLAPIPFSMLLAHLPYSYHSPFAYGSAELCDAVAFLDRLLKTLREHLAE